jgi:hypothetical protein
VVSTVCKSQAYFVTLNPRLSVTDTICLHFHFSVSWPDMREKITSYIYITSKFSGSWICLTRFCNGSWGKFFWICYRHCTPARASTGCTPPYFVTLLSTGRRAKRPSLLSTAQARTQYPLDSCRCDDVTSSSENCKADGFYADPQH